MAFRAVFHPDIEHDVLEAMDRYDQNQPGVGARFRRQFYETVDTILEMPRKHGIRFDDIRATLVNRFPYLIFYCVEGEIVYMLTVQYAGRRPSQLRKVARSRKQ